MSHKLTLACSIITNPIFDSIPTEVAALAIMYLKYSFMLGVHSSVDRIGVFERSIPVSHIHEKLWYIDQQFADDYIPIFGNIVCNHRHKQSFEHVVD